MTDGKFLGKTVGIMPEALNDVVKLVSLDCELSLLEIYEAVTFDESVLTSHLRPLE